MPIHCPINSEKKPSLLPVPFKKQHLCILKVSPRECAAENQDIETKKS